jgi:4-hydroxybenzoate polyprenyltransferase
LKLNPRQQLKLETKHIYQIRDNLIKYIIEQARQFSFSVLMLITSTPLLLSLNGSMVAVFSFHLFGLKAPSILLLATFLVTLSTYSLNKVTDKTEDSINLPKSTKLVNYSLFISLVSMATGLTIGWLYGFLSFIVLLAPLAIGLIYSIKPAKSIPRLKAVLGGKSIAVAISWALTGSLLPATVNLVDLEKIIMVFFYIFIRIFVGTVLCDVPDQRGDLASSIKTIPISLGREKTKKLLTIINSLAIVWIIYNAAKGVFIQFIPVTIFGALYGYLTIWYFFKDKCNWFRAKLMLDGEWIPLVTLLIIFFK